jgi:hypothetical protein
MNEEIKKYIGTNQHGILFHGSRKRFSKIMPHKGRNPNGGKSENQYGVYATPNIMLAFVYALSVRRSSFIKPKIKIIHYSEDKINVVFENCYLAHRPGFIYVLSSEEFLCNNDNEFFSSKPIRYNKCIIATFEDFHELIDKEYIVIEEDLPPDSALYRMSLDWVDSFTCLFSHIRHLFYKTRKAIHIESKN